MKILCSWLGSGLFIFILACSPGPSSLINKFQKNKTGFDELVSFLKTFPLNVGYSIDETKFPENIQDQLADLEITDINASISHCGGIVEYEFVSGWTKMSHVYFSKNTCDTTITQKGYYAKRSELVEVWGLGDGWFMWIDHDFY